MVALHYLTLHRLDRCATLVSLHYHTITITVWPWRYAAVNKRLAGSNRWEPRGSGCARRSFASFFGKQLTPHFRAEEKVLFPFMREAVPESAALLDDLLRDHEAFRQVPQKLTAGAGLSKLIFDVGDLLERHIRREERELFPLFEQRVEGSKAEVVGAKIKKILDENV